LVEVGVIVGGEIIVGVKVMVGVGVDEGSVVGVTVLVRVGRGVYVGEGMGVFVEVGGGKNGVLLGVGVVLIVGVWVMVGVLVVVPVEVRVGVWLGVKEPVGDSMVKVIVDVWVAKTTAVQDEVRVGVMDACPILPGARSTATSPAQ
jgi:hypothetical protein